MTMSLTCDQRVQEEAPVLPPHMLVERASLVRAKVALAPYVAEGSWEVPGGPATDGGNKGDVVVLLVPLAWQVRPQQRLCGAAVYAAELLHGVHEDFVLLRVKVALPSSQALKQLSLAASSR